MFISFRYGIDCFGNVGVLFEFINLMARIDASLEGPDFKYRISWTGNSHAMEKLTYCSCRCWGTVIQRSGLP